MTVKYFQIITHNWRCTHIFLLSLHCYNSYMSQFSLLVLRLHVYHICHLCMLHWSDWCLLILDSIFYGLTWIYLFFMINVLFNNIVWQDWHFTIAVVVGVVDNFLPRNFFTFKLGNSYFLSSSIDCVKSRHIVLPTSLVKSNKIALRRLLRRFYQVMNGFLSR